MKIILKLIPFIFFINMSVFAASSLSDASYSLGYFSGQRAIKSFSIDQSAYMDGLKAALENKPPIIKEDKMGEIISSYMTQNVTENVLKNQTQLLSIEVPSVGKKDSKVIVIELFDYQCSYCYKLYPTVKKVMSENENVLFKFYDNPIFAVRSPASMYAAEVGLIAYKQLGSKAYEKYQNAIFELVKKNNSLEDKDVNEVASRFDIDIAKINDSDKAEIEKNMSFAKELGAMGTPVLIIMPSKNADEKNTTVFMGYPGNPTDKPEDTLKLIQDAINKAGKNI